MGHFTSERERRAAAFDPNTPPEILIQLAFDSDHEVRRRVALNPKVPLEALVRLATDPDGCVRIAVAHRSNTPAGILAWLANDRYKYVRYYVAQNLNTPVEALVRLVDDPDEDVRYEATQNPNVPIEVFVSRAQVIIAELFQRYKTKAAQITIPGLGPVIVFTDDDLKARPVHPVLLRGVLLPALSGDRGIIVHDRGIIAVSTFVYSGSSTPVNETVSRDRFEQLVLAVQFATPEIPQPLMIPIDSEGVEFIEEPALVPVTSGGEQLPEEFEPKAKPLGTVCLAALVDPFDVFNGQTGLLSYRLKGTNLTRFVFGDPVPVTPEIKQKLRDVPKLGKDQIPRNNVPHVETNGSYIYALWHPFEEWEYKVIQ